MRKRLLPLCALSTAFLLSSFSKAQAQNTSPYWSLAGNSNASSSSKLGTTNSIPLRLYTKNSERLRIDTLGRIGMGTTSSGARLTVNASTGMVPFVAQVNGSTKLYLSSNGGLSVGGSSKPPTNGLFVSGNVGIGTATPTAKLHVVGKSIFTNTVTVGGGMNVNASSGTTMSISNWGDNSDSTTHGGLRVETEYGYAIDAFSDNDIGVKSFGRSFGVSGASENVGVRGASNYGTGVYGYSSDGKYGVSGKGNGAGVYGEGGGVGVYGQSDYAGVQGKGGSGYGGDFQSTDNSGIRASTTNGVYAAEFNGKVYASGGYTTSDKNLKQNIQEFSDAMNIIRKLKPRHYEFKTDEKYAFLHLENGMHYGLLAQDVEEVLPNLVSTANH